MKSQIIKSKNNKTKYEKIYHISDIHIRNTEDHKIIYEHVFDNLYKYLESVKNINSLIVITGDILHNKDKLTATGEEICINFFEKLSSIMETIIIAGNHDFNEKNNNILDSISIILYKRNLENIHYLRESGIYRFNNIIFGVSSLIDNKFIKASDINEKGMKIALYHGAVNNSKNSKGFEFSDQSLTKFDGYDLTLLGDIHFYQYLNDDKTIAYSSSLISQNFSETDKYHGVLVWNLIDKTSEYKIIENDYQFSELVIKDNNIFYDNNKININKLVLPKYSKLRITHMDCNQTLYNNIVDSIKITNPSVNIIHNKLISNNINIGKDNKMNPKNNYLENIIEEELKDIPKEYYNDVKKLLSIELKNSIQNIDNKLNWKLISLKFSNIFTYGKDNIIDFTKLTFDEITGLFGPNSSGKSSLVDILLFSLFDDYSRNNQDKHKILNGTLINTNENIFSCSVKFNINNILYEINKEGKRKKAKTQNTYDSFDFTKYEFGKFVDDKYIPLNGVDRIETLSNIIKLIGTYNDFCISSICFQNNSKNKIDFLNMTPNDRKNFLNINFNLDGYKIIENKYKIKLSELKAEVKALNNLDDYKYYINNDLLIEKFNKDLIDIKININNYKASISKIKEDYDKLFNNLKPIDDKFKNITIIELEKIIVRHNFIINENKNKLLKLKKYDMSDNKYIHKLYQQNMELTKQLLKNNENNLDIDIYKNKLLKIKNKINKLELIENKEQIILSNQIFEKHKINKIIEMKSKILPDYYIFNSTHFSNYYINDLQNIHDSIFINSYDTQINDLIIKKNMYELWINNITCIDIFSKLCFNTKCKDCSNNYNLINKSHPRSFSKNIRRDYCNILKEEIINIDQSIDNYNKLVKNNDIYIDFKNNIKKHIDDCKQNNYLIDLYIIENTVNKKFKKLNKQLSKYNKLVKKQEKLIILIDDYNNNLKSIENNNLINKQIEANKNIIDDYIKTQELFNNFNNIIKESNEYIQKINININNKKFNDLISININNIKIQLDELENKLTYDNNLYFEKINNLEKMNNQKNKYNNIFNKINKIIKDIELNCLIFDMVCSKGIPRKIINIKLQTIENDVNNILKNFITKKIEITKEIEDIKVLIHDNINKINFGGGMESFIIMLAFKVAFISVFNIPHCGLLVIDEGVSVLDKEYASKFNIICDFIKKYYNHIILITHIDTFYDYTVDNIKISKKANKSFVSFI